MTSANLRLPDKSAGVTGVGSGDLLGHMVKYKLMLQSGCCKVSVPMEQACDARAETRQLSANAKPAAGKNLPAITRLRAALGWSGATRANAPETPGCSAIFVRRRKQSGAS